MWDSDDEEPILLTLAETPEDLVTENDLYLPDTLQHVSPVKIRGPKKRSPNPGGDGRKRVGHVSSQGIASKSSDHGGNFQELDLPAPPEFYPGGGDLDMPDAEALQGQEKDESYEEFAAGVSMGTIGLYQISKNYFVCEGWDKRCGGTNGQWYHLQSLEGHDGIFICNCPGQPRCVHEAYMREEGGEAFADEEGKHREDSLSNIVLFSREETLTQETISLFSVATPHKPDVLKARAIVTNQGDSLGNGTWSCTRDTRHTCVHISQAKKYLLKINGIDETHSEDDTAVEIDEMEVRIPKGDKAVSYLPIMPPVWAMLSEDEIIYKRSKAPTPPSLFRLGQDARCSCGASRNDAPPTVMDCTIYTLTKAFAGSVEVQICHACSTGRRRYVGPDCRELGFFNYNNRALFEHALFDDYTAAFTSSETPFAAWASVMARRYETMESRPFVSTNLFRTVWFLFVDLQVLTRDMTCPECGTYPEDTIWDGVTLAFSRRQLLSSLCPPTTVLKEAPDHHSQYIYKQALIIEADLRRTLRGVVSGPSLLAELAKAPQVSAPTVEGIDEEEEEAQAQASTRKASEDALRRLTNIPAVYSRLNEVNRHLGSLFKTHFGVEALQAKVQIPRAYSELFRQIAAEESVLQMIPAPALSDLIRFQKDPTEKSRAHLLSIPAIYNVLKHHETQGRSHYPADLLGTIEWVIVRVIDVMSRLITPSSPLEPAQRIQEDPWQESGCYYSMPAIRRRPRYPKLKHDQVNEGSKRGATCSKFYGQYGQQRLTGGIMCVWCTHSVCYGFHCIPQGEGRNDVFSAIITRWPEAPKRVIYDFACALGPYCMTREPNFFAKTQFVIDDFHASGHTKCSPAAFLKSYAQVDPRLARINTSAAECGNGGISRIRKGVSYMGQKRAIMFTQVFISIWNRVMIRKLRKEG